MARTGRPRPRRSSERAAAKSIALPRVATGVGGLDWDEVRPLIEQRLDGLEIPIYVYAKYVPSQQAEEPGL